MPEPLLLTIAQIAAWKDPARATTTSAVIAEPPPLQRGLVWSPLQTELLWDSLLRGFPIGSLVVCHRRATHAPRRPMDRGAVVTHDLLDGQQRAQGIALGYSDPFGDAPDGDPILWLDLAYQRPSGTRRYLFRVTTKAHPWGYARHDDSLQRLSLFNIRAALNEAGFADNSAGLPGRGRSRRLPTPKQCRPQDATAPIPFAWVLSACGDNALAATALRDALLDRLDRHMSLRWAGKAVEHLRSDAGLKELGRLAAGVALANRALIPCLDVADHLLGRATAGGAETDGDDIEHLFLRINNGGTRMDADELRYSMIKAWWPEVKQTIESIKPRRVPEARLVVLGSRLALKQDATRKCRSPWSGEVSLTELRKHLASSPDQPHGAALRAMLNDSDEELAGIRRIMATVQAWLEHSDAGCPHGLPPVLVTSIARSSPDVLLLLMWLADACLEAGRAPDTADWSRRVSGLATSLHWLSNDKGRATSAIAQELAERMKGAIGIGIFDGILGYAGPADNGRKDESIIRPLTPEQFDTEILLPDCADLDKWRWWALPPYGAVNRPAADCVQRMKSQTELLIYAQRAYLCRNFGDYDPARKDSWDRADRPWDFDHILAKDRINYQDLGPHKDALRAWAMDESIANLRAWWREENRSDQATLPAAKILGSCVMRDSFIDEPELAAFNLCADKPHDPELALGFICAAKKRLVRIYSEWFTSLDIAAIAPVD